MGDEERAVNHCQKWERERDIERERCERSDKDIIEKDASMFSPKNNILFYIFAASPILHRRIFVMSEKYYCMNKNTDFGNIFNACQS